MGGFPNPILDEIDQHLGSMSPHAQQAVTGAMQRMQPAAMASSTPQQAQVQQPQQQQQPAAPQMQAPRHVPQLPSIAGEGQGATPPAQPTPSMSQPQAPQRGTLAGDEGELSRLRTSGSGVSQIHNPWLRGLATAGDAIGSGLFPKIAMAIPGTQAHHGLLEHEAQNQVNSDEAEQNAASKRNQEQAQTADLSAQAEQRLHPAPKEPTNAFEQWARQNPTAPVSDFIKMEQAAKPEAQPKTPFEVWAKQNPNGTAADWLKLEAQNKPAKDGNDFEQFYKDYLSEHQQPDSAHARMQARSQWAAASQAPQRAPQVTVMVPNQDGGYTAQAVHSGQSVAPGAVTTAGMNSLNTPTSQTRTMAETAPKVMDLSNRIGQLIDQQEKSLGPAASRWSEFMAGKVGAPNPEFTKLRTDVGLLQTALMRMHMGARGGEQMMQHFHNLIDVSKQDPQNLRAALEEIRAYAQEVGKSGHANMGGGEQQQQGPVAGTVENGYRFRGGNAADKNNWEKVK